MEYVEKDFLEANPRRANSREIDFGFSWHWIGRQYRVAYYVASEEIVAICQGKDIYEIIGTAPRESVHASMEGWETAHNRLDRNSLDWVRRRVGSS
jgi:hypothetical protein